MNSERQPFDRWLLLFCTSRTLVAVASATYPGTLPALRDAWLMSATAAGSVSAGYFFGVTSAFVLATWLADRVGARRALLWSTWLATIASMLWAAFARSYETGLALYTAVGVGQGATYGTALMVTALRYPEARRGRAIGWLLASASLASAVSLIAAGVAVTWSDGDYRLAFLLPACASVIGLGLLHYLLSTVSNVMPSPSRVEVQADETRATRRTARLLICGYVGHSWEIAGAWTWTPAFIASALTVAGLATTRAIASATYIGASFQLVGFVALSSMGALSDRVSRRSLLAVIAASGAGGSAVFGWLVDAPVPLIVAVGALYTFAMLGDSSVLSAALTEAVPPSRLGRALAVRAALAAVTGAMAPAAVGAVLDATNNVPGAPIVWGWAFMVLAVGGLLATACALALPRTPR